ncbi:MAG: hypothetical protein R6X02_04875 [Enhygromyxa sp.]
MRRTVELPLCVTIAIVACSAIACVGNSGESGLPPFAASEGGLEDGDTGEAPAESGDDMGEYDRYSPRYPDDSSDEGDEPSIKFDLSDHDYLVDKEVPCGVDILFVIDNSGSMSQHKQDIVDAFDSFIDEMLAALQPGTPVHVGITRATGFFDPGNGSGWNDPSCNFGFLDGVWNPPTQANNGVNGQQGRLYENDGLRYFEYHIGESPTMLGDWFEGALMGSIAIDLASNSESVVAAAAYPFHPVNAEYNAGFLRSKAVLVLFLISDAPDATPAEIPTADFIDIVSEAKAECGDGCVLPTGLIQSACYGDPGNVNTRLFDFMNGFGAPPAALDFFKFNMPPESFTSVLGTTLAESIAYTCEHIVPAE